MEALNNKNSYEHSLVQAAIGIAETAKAQNAHKDLTLAQAIKRYVARKSYCLNTRRKYNGFLTAVGKQVYMAERQGACAEALSARPINDITIDDLEDFVFGYRERWTENSTYNLQVFIRQVFKYAKKKKWLVGDDPSEELEARKKTRRLRVPMPMWLMHKLIEQCHDPRLKCFLLLCSYALRAGEAAAMTARSIIGENTLFVFYTQAWMDNDLRGEDGQGPKSTLGLGPPKSEHGFRPIEINPEDWAIIEESMACALEDSVLTYDRGRVEERFLIPNSHGGQWRTDHIRRALKIFLASLEDKEIGMFKASLPHNWRASVITNLLDGGDDDEAGESLAAVQKFVGHSRVDVTADIYHQATMKGRLKVSRRLGQVRRGTVKALGQSMLPQT